MRRLADAGLPHLFSPRSFRVTVVTDLLNQNVPLKDVRYLAGHSNPRTTQIYDRRRRRVARNIVERLSGEVRVSGTLTSGNEQAGLDGSHQCWQKKGWACGDRVE
jgi:hypothetical protein